MTTKKIGPFSTSKNVLGNLNTYYAAVLSQKWETDYNVALRKAAKKR